MASDAVGLERISRVVGYKFTKGDSSEVTENLPQRIAVLAEANEANQVSLSLAAQEILSSQQAGDLYGYGSPIHQIIRILKPVNGTGVGGIPVIVYPQAKAGGAAAKVLTVTPTGTATKSGTHFFVISGRYGVDGVSYEVNIVVGDTAAVIATKAINAINAVLGAPVIATSPASNVVLTTKWNGLTANETNVSVDTNGDDLGVTYAVVATTPGTGTPSIAAALNLFGSAWNTLVVNSYGFTSSALVSLESFNGIPDPDNPTGRFNGIIMKPFTAITGSVLDDPTSVTDGRLNDVTIALAPAPLSKGYHWEAAANMTVLQSRVAQDTPELDVAGQFYPDMPTPVDIGLMSVYSNRDAFVKKGASTVDLIAGRYQVQDFVTTYHPVGENPPQYRFVRSLTQDFNIRYTYHIQEQINVIDHFIANDNDVVSLATKVIKPKQWKQVMFKMFDQLVARGLIVDAVFSQKSAVINISTTNPDRLETFFKYKRSGFTRIASTTAEANFNFGSVN